MMAPANALGITMEIHVQVNFNLLFYVQIHTYVFVITVMSFILSQHFVMMMLHAMVMEPVEQMVPVNVTINSFQLTVQVSNKIFHLSHNKRLIHSLFTFIRIL